MSDSPNQASTKRSETIVVAVIGLVGVLFTAALSNWDKLFFHTVTAKYVGYEPTGNIETEIRYLMEVNGFRATMNSMKDSMEDNAKKQMTSEDPNHPEIVEKYINFMHSNTPSYDDILTQIIPVWEKHFNLEEIQELNRFYSTPQMQQMVKASPEVNRELTPILMKIMNDFHEKLIKAEAAGEFKADSKEDSSKPAQ